MIYGVSDVIVVAFVSGLFLVLTAAVTGLFGWIAATAGKKAVGTPNGKGNVVEMLERLLTRQEKQGEELAVQSKALGAVLRKQTDFDNRMKKLEQVHGLETEGTPNENH